MPGQGIDKSTKVSIGLVLAVFGALLYPGIQFSSRLTSLATTAEASNQRLLAIETATRDVQTEVQGVRVSVASIKTSQTSYDRLVQEKMTMLQERIGRMEERIRVLEQEK